MCVSVRNDCGSTVHINHSVHSTLYIEYFEPQSLSEDDRKSQIMSLPEQFDSKYPKMEWNTKIKLRFEVKEMESVESTESIRSLSEFHRVCYEGDSI